MISVRKDFLFSTGIMAFCLAVGCFLVLTRQDLTQTSGFLFADQGFNLLVSDHLFKGERLYRDILYFYGPVPAYLFAAFGRFFGNTMLSYNFFHLALSVPAIGLAYFLLRRSVSASTAFLVAVLGLFPTFLTPGSPLGGASHSAYIPFDRLFLLGMGFLWQPPEKRSYSHGLLTGFVLGAWHGIKFGGSVFAAAAFLLLDLLVLVRNRADRTIFFQWMRWVLALSAGILGVEAVWILSAYAFLPPAIAWDALFPAFHIEIGKSTVGNGLGPRWIEWGNWRLFIGHYLIPVSALLFCFFEIFHLLMSFRRPTLKGRGNMQHFGLYFYLLFYALGSVVYFQHSYTFRGYMWMLVLPAAYLLDRLKLPARLLAGAFWLPGCLLMLKIIFVNPVSPDMESFLLPNGERVWMEPKTAGVVEEILTFLNTGQPAKEDSIVLFIRLGAGLHHFYGIPHLPRQVWFTKGYVRPYDEKTLNASLDRVRAVVVEEQRKISGAALPLNPCSLIAVAPFSQDLCGALEARLAPPVRLEGGYWLYAAKTGEMRPQV